MATSFKGTSFHERFQGDRLPVLTGGGFKVTHHIPGSDSNDTDLLGADTEHVTVLATMTLSQYTTFRGYRNKSGTLIFSLGTFTAIMDDISKAEQIDLDGNLYEVSMNYTI